MERHRVFIGFWDDGEPDWTVIDEIYDSWEAACDRVKGYLIMYANDECDECRQNAIDGIAKLETTFPGTEFECEIDGDDVMIMKDGSLK